MVIAIAVATPAIALAASLVRRLSATASSQHAAAGTSLIG
jgi:hypothetical protein